MQKTAPDCPATAPALGPCPTDEEIAAYIDGGLDRAEWERITDHLASCESCYASFSITAQLLVEPGPATPEDEEIDRRILEFPSGHGRLAAQWGSIAAVLLAGVGAGTYYQMLASPPPLMTSDLTAPIRGEHDLVQQFWVGPTNRGGSRGEGQQPAKPFLDASFQLGVQLVDLQVMLEAGDSERAVKDIIPRIQQVLESHALFSDLKNPYRELTGSLSGKAVQQAALERAQQIATKARDYADEHHLDLGQWVETARLAAVAKTPSFFQQSSTRSFLRRLLWRDRVGLGDFKLDPPTRASLEAISDVLSKGDLQAPHYAEIRRETEKVLKIYYPE